MQTLSSYRKRQSGLLETIEELQSLLTAEQLRVRPNARIAYELLCDLGDKVKQHLAEEDKGLYPSLLIHDDPKVKSIAWGFISGEKPLRKTFDDYYDKWLKQCDFNFTDEFIEETRSVFDLLQYRIEREYQVLFPKLVEIGMFREARA
jgi:hemerythrin-like domain-containing protein